VPALLAGRSFSWHDDKKAPRVAVINKEFARKIFGCVPNATGRYYKIQDGTRVQVVGIVENGKYRDITEDPRPAMFFPILQSPSSGTTLVVVRSNRDPQQLTAAMRSTLRDLDAGYPLTSKRGAREWTQVCSEISHPSAPGNRVILVVDDEPQI